MLTMTTRTFRAHMGKNLLQEEPIILGDPFQHTALVIPLPRGPRRDHPRQRRGLAKAQAAANTAFRELRKAHE